MVAFDLLNPNREIVSGAVVDIVGEKMVMTDDGQTSSTCLYHSLCIKGTL